MNNQTLLKKQEPLYCQIRDILKSQIAQSFIKPGEAIPSLAEISQNFGVSMITARQAVGKLLDEGLLYVIRGKGTFVTEKPFKKVTIGVTVDFEISVHLEDIPLHRTALIHLREWMDFLSLESSSNNFLPINIPTSLNDEEFQCFMESNSVAGMIILGPKSWPLIEPAVNYGVPYVVLGELIGGRETGNFVVYNNYIGAVKAAQYLVDKGHHKIGILAGTKAFYGYRERLHGYRDALLQNKISPEHIYEIEAQSGVDGGYWAAKELLCADNIPTALLCSSDFKALGAVKAAAELGLRIPHDIAIVGYDGLSLPSEESLPLTTVCIPKREMIQKGLNFLFKASVGQHSAAPVTIQEAVEPVMIIGDTA